MERKVDGIMSAPLAAKKESAIRASQVIEQYRSSKLVQECPYMGKKIELCDIDMNKSSKIVAAVIVALLAVGGTAYYVFGSGGSLNIQVKDPLPSGWSALYINVSSVSIHNSTGGSGGGYLKSFSTPVSVNLANATSKSLFLTSLKLPNGHYQMIRLTITGAYGVYSGKTYKISLVSSSVDVAGQFTISSGSTTTVTLDFNSTQAVHGDPASGFTMTPVVAETVG